MKARVLGMLVVLIAVLGAAPEAASLLLNGDFEAAEPVWTLPGGAQVVAPGQDGGHALRVANPTPRYSFAQQSVLLDGRRYRQVTLAAWMQWSDVVRGRETWEGARMHVTFHDRAGRQLGGWPDAGIFSGSSDWRRIEKQFDVPPETARVVVYLGLQDCTGTVWFDDVRLTAIDAEGHPAPRITESRTDTYGWLPFAPPPDPFAPSAIDMSRLLDPPAGKHGFIRVRRQRSAVSFQRSASQAVNGSAAGGAALPALEFAGGTPARFWGVDIVAANCFPDHRTAERVAQRLARAGCNLVRFHHMDAFWSHPNLFDPAFDNTQHLSTDSLDRLDYLMAQLKKRGIYFYVDLAVNRKLKAGDRAPEWDQVEAGLKIVGHFDPRLIELQKLYARQLMTHRNRYTRLRLIDDPAVVFQEVINESTLFWSQLDAIPPYYAAELRRLFGRWLMDRYRSRMALAHAWAEDPEPLAAGEDPAGGTVRLAPGGELDRTTSAPASARVRDTLLFLHHVQTGYFQQMRQYLRGLGARYLITGSNHWTSTVAELDTEAGMDFIDRHSYWAHPQGGYGWKGIRFDNVPALAGATQESGPASSLSRQALLHQPYVSSEWEYAWPNEYRLEGVPLVAGYAAFQGWSAAMQFEYSGGDWARVIEGNFDVGNKPDEWAQWPAMALMLHRGDLAGAHTVTVVGTGPDPKLDREAIGCRLSPGVETRAVVRTQLGASLAPASASTQSAPGPLERRPGLFLIRSPRTQVVAGFLREAGRLASGSITLDSPTEFGSVIVSSLTSEPIARSRHLLITTVGRAENTGMVYGPARDTVLDPGHTPIRMDPVRGTLSIYRAGAAPLQVNRLDLVGRRSERVAATAQNGVLRLPLEGSRLTLWYEATVVSTRRAQ